MIVEQKTTKRNWNKSKKCFQKRDKVLTTACPSHDCQMPVQLLCPFCEHGALSCDEEFMVLSCHHCHNALHHFPCSHCDFPIKASYIQEKQRAYRKAEKKADGSQFIATLVIFAMAYCSLWAITSFYS